MSLVSRMQWPLEKRIFPRTFTDTRNACRSVLAHISITINHSGPRKQKEAFPTPQPELPSHPCADTTPVQVSPGTCKHLMLRNLVRVESRGSGNAIAPSVLLIVPIRRKLRSLCSIILITLIAVLFSAF